MARWGRSVGIDEGGIAVAAIAGAAAAAAAAVPGSCRREPELRRRRWAGVAAKSSTSDPQAMQTGKGKHAGRAQAMSSRVERGVKVKKKKKENEKTAVVMLAQVVMILDRG